MKNLMKKLTAGLLAGVVLLGSVVTASASESQQLGQKHESVGTTANEGTAPEDRLSIVLPTARTGMFDFIVDPSGRIIRTNGKKYAMKYDREVTVDDGKLYFVNFITADDTEIVSLSKKSETLKIVNKSNFPVNVSWDVEIDKGSNDFVFSQDAAFRDVATSTPAMYLALVSDRAYVPVSTKRDGNSEKHSASISGWIKKPSEDVYELTYLNGTYQYQEKEKFQDVVNDPALTSVSFYMTGAINDGNWSDSGDDVTLNVTWAVNKERGPDTDPNPVIPTVAVTQNATAGGEQVTLKVTLADKAKVNRIAYVRNGELNYLTPTVNDTTVTFTPNAITLNTATDWQVEFTEADGSDPALIPFDPKTITPIGPDDVIEPVGPVESPTVTVTKGASAGGQQVTLDVTLGSAARVNRIAYTRNGAVNYITPTVSGTTVTFTPNAIIYNNASDWKVEFTDASGANPTLIAFNIKENADSGNSGDGGNTSGGNVGTAPTVTVTKGASAGGQQVTLDVTLGSMAKVNRIAYTRSGSVNYLTPAVSGTTVTFTPNAIVYNNASDWKVEFTDASSANPTLIAFDIKENADSGNSGDGSNTSGGNVGTTPTVTVTKGASAGRQQVTLDVTLGSMAKVNRIAYTRSGSVNYLTPAVSGTTVTFTPNAIVYNNASDWKVEFTDANGANPTLIAFDIKENADSGNSSDGGNTSSGNTGTAPTVTVTKGASAGGQQVTLSVTLGSAAKVNRIAYTRSGSVNYITPTVSGTTVTFTPNAIVYNNASDWKVEFTDANGTNPTLIAFNIKEKADSGNSSDGGNTSSGNTGTAPTVTVTKGASAGGQQVTLSVTLGSAAKVNRIVYTRSGSVNYITPTVSGTTVTFTPTALIYNNASDWKVEFMDSSGTPTLIAFNITG